MGAHIEAVRALASHGLRRPTARGLADAAARSCLQAAGRDPAEVDLLINAGIYREDNMGEPALAALIQEDLGANLGQPPLGGHGTFSFDLLNGTCGVISALHLESGLLRSGVIGLGAVVTSDVSPPLTGPAALPLRPAGGAMLLAWDDTETGFTSFAAETFPEYQDLLTSGLVWQQRHRPRRAGHHQMIMQIKPGYQARLADCADDAAQRFLRRLGLGTSDIDLLIPAPSPPGFPDAIRARLGIPGDRVAYVAEDLAGAYTTGLIAAIQAALRSGRLEQSRTTLLLAAGAGITITLALYHHPPP